MLNFTFGAFPKSQQSFLGSYQKNTLVDLRELKEKGKKSKSVGKLFFYFLDEKIPPSPSPPSIYEHAHVFLFLKSYQTRHSKPGFLHKKTDISDYLYF